MTLNQNTNYDYNLNCYQITQEIQKAQSYKVYARRKDRFSLKNMAIIPALSTAIKAPKMEKKADERIAHLQNIYRSKYCPTN